MKRMLACVLCLLLALSLGGCAEYEQLVESIEQTAQAVNEAKEEIAPAQTPAIETSEAQSEVPAIEASAAQSEKPVPEATPEAAAAQDEPAPVSPVPAASEAPQSAAPAAPSPLECVLAEFEELAKIPRASHNESAVSSYLCSWAKEHGLQSVQDEIGNVIIDLPASTGCEKAPLIVLQAHMDMVSVAASGKVFDPAKDGIEIISDGKTLKANGTSLGADDGIGVATILYILSAEEPVHGPVRAIFTVDEEDSMTGAESLSAEYLADAAYLLNLDNETLGSVLDSCAGCAGYRFSAAPAWKAPQGDTAYEISLSKLCGGHSGVCIHMGRANAIKEIARVLGAVYSEGLTPEIAALSGGTVSNAIPDEAKLTVVLHGADAEAFENVVSAQIEAFQARYGKIETEASFVCSKLATLPERVLYAPIGKAFSDMLCLCPDGVNTMRIDGSGMVESSSNLGVLSLDENELYCELLTRSSVQAVADEQMEVLRLLSSLCGVEMRQLETNPAWEQASDNRLVELVTAAYKLTTGEEARVESVHGSTECGYFMEKNPKLHCASIGATIENVHTPKEIVHIDTIETNLEVVLKVLETISAE